MKLTQQELDETLDLPFAEQFHNGQGALEITLESLTRKLNHEEIVPRDITLLDKGELSVIGFNFPVGSRVAAPYATKVSAQNTRGAYSFDFAAAEEVDLYGSEVFFVRADQAEKVSIADARNFFEGSFEQAKTINITGAVLCSLSAPNAELERNEEASIFEHIQGSDDIPSIKKMAHTINHTLNFGVPAASIGYALCDAPAYFMNDAWGIAVSVVYGASNWLIASIGMVAGCLGGAAITKKSEPDPYVTIGNILASAVFGGTIALTVLAPKAYDMFKDLREPYKDNAKETTYAPSQIHTQKMASAATYQIN